MKIKRFRIPYFVIFYKIKVTPTWWTEGWRGWRMKTWFLYARDEEGDKIRTRNRPIFMPRWGTSPPPRIRD